PAAQSVASRLVPFQLCPAALPRREVSADDRRRGEGRAAAVLLDAYADRGGEGETRPRGRQPSAGAHLRGEAELLRTRRAAQVERRTGGSGAHSRRAAEGGFAGVTLGRWCDRAAPTANAALAHELAACPNRAPTARFQPAYLRSRSFAGNAGLKPRSSFH